MAKRPTITPVQVGDASAAINANFNRIAAQFDLVFSRDGAGPNQLTADLDANSNDLLNVGELDALVLKINGSDISTLLENAVSAAAGAIISAASAANSANQAQTAASDATTAAQSATNSALSATNSASAASTSATSAATARTGAEAAAVSAGSSAATAAQNAGFLPAQITQIKAEDIAHVYQSSLTLPPRPPRQVVYWHTWDDPSAVMEDPDVWLELPAPSLPLVLPDDMWDWSPTRATGQCAIRINYVPNYVPAIDNLRYRINGGAWVNFTVARGYTLIGSLTNGVAQTCEIQLHNYLGWGAASAVKSATPLVATQEEDTFTRADGVLLSTIPVWDCKNGTSLTHSNNGVSRSTSGSGSNPYGGSAAPAIGLAVHRGYFTDAQWVEAQFEGVGTNTLFGPGVILQGDTRLARGGQGYVILIKPSACRIYKMIDGAYQLVATLFYTTLTAPQNLRVEYNSGVITVKDLNAGSATLGSWTDTTGTGLPTFGRPGLQSSWPGTGSVTDGRILNWKAGNI